MHRMEFRALNMRYCVVELLLLFNLSSRSVTSRLPTSQAYGLGPRHIEEQEDNE